jgi:hypothetical protein
MSGTAAVEAQNLNLGGALKPGDSGASGRLREEEKQMTGDLFPRTAPCLKGRRRAPAGQLRISPTMCWQLFPPSRATSMQPPRLSQNIGAPEPIGRDAAVCEQVAPGFKPLENMS